MNKVPQLHGRIYHFNGDKYYKIEDYKMEDSMVIVIHLIVLVFL